MNSSRLLLDALIEVLSQGQILLEQTEDEIYSRKLPVVFNASIGGHYRHCLDHFSGLFASLDKAELNYDLRKRDPRIETDRLFALEMTSRLLSTAKKLPEELTSQHMIVRCKVSYLDEESPAAASTIGREMMYAIAHAVHHYALIGVMCGLMKVPVPPGFGVAPSTIKHLHEMNVTAAA
jgi:hypothetical protein